MTASARSSTRSNRRPRGPRSPDSFGTEAYLRPLRIAQIKGLFDLAQGSHYWLVYRGFHALLLIAAVHALRPCAPRLDRRSTSPPSAFALVVLFGLHTFRGTVQEAFPSITFSRWWCCASSR